MVKKIYTYDVDTFALGRVLRLYDPHVALFLRLETVEVRVEVGEFVRQNVRVRNDIKRLFAKLLLYFYDVFAEPVLASQLG